MRLLRPLAFAALTLLGVGCNSYADALSRGQHAFEANEHERALAIFRGLEPEVAHLSPSDRARYAYLRGMTDYRIGYKAEARHWLALAAATETQARGALPDNWARRMNDALTDLNEAVYKGGITSLSNTPAPVANAAADDDGGTPESATP